jgi:hypothetical protein
MNPAVLKFSLLIGALVVFEKCNCYTEDPILYGQFPDGFVWALATASYQIEGGYREDGGYMKFQLQIPNVGYPTIFQFIGKSDSIWDTFTHAGGNIIDGSTGDVACDSYHKWEDDITMLKEVGVRTPMQNSFTYTGRSLLVYLL